MDKNFDDLFNDFFKRNDKLEQSDYTSKIRDDFRKILETMMRLTPEKLDEKFIDQNIGEPDKVEKFSDGVFTYEKRTWHTPNGDIVRILATELENSDVIEEPKLSLQEQLDKALETENFEEAARLRDLINPPNKKRRRTRVKKD